MDKKFIEKQKEKLVKQKQNLKDRLSSFAQESNQAKGDWDAKMPVFAENANLEEAADEVEEFGTRLALEKSLEQELKKIVIALERIKRNKYGICEKCGKLISKGRLNVYPQAECCIKCR